MTDDFAIAGEAGGYVPCREQAAVQAPPDNTVAIFGEDEGYVPDLTAAAALAGDDGDSYAVAGRSAGFVAKPCEFTCPDVEALDVTPSYQATFARNSSTGLSAGPFYTFVFGVNPIYVLVHDFYDGETVTDEEVRNYERFDKPGLSPTVWFQGDLYVNSAEEPRPPTAPPSTSWDLVAVYYSGADIFSQTDLDLSTLPQTVIASGVHPGGYDVPQAINVAFTNDTSHDSVAFYLRPSPTATLLTFSDPGLVPRYPDHGPEPYDFASISLEIPTYTVSLADCEL